MTIKDKVFIVCCIAWFLIWGYQFSDDIKEHWQETKALCGKSLDTKWEYVLGEELYEFLKVAEGMIPIQAGVSFYNGMETYKAFRAQYYMYPRTWPKEKTYIMDFRANRNIEDDYDVIFSDPENGIIYQKGGF